MACTMLAGLELFEAPKEPTVMEEVPAAVYPYSVLLDVDRRAPVNDSFFGSHSSKRVTIWKDL
jgi:hypothetical protein